MFLLPLVFTNLAISFVIAMMDATREAHSCRMTRANEARKIGHGSMLMKTTSGENGLRNWAFHRKN